MQLLCPFDDAAFPDKPGRPGVNWDRVIDGLGDAVVGVPGDGFGSYGGWVTTLGSGCKIHTASNNPLSTGKGLRHFRCNAYTGKDNNSGGIAWSFSSTPLPEVWIRYYMRYQQGFTWKNNKPVYTKDVELRGPTGNSRISIGHQGGAWGFYKTSSGAHAAPVEWSELMNGPKGDGLFHCFEYHFNLSGGIAEMWLDDVLMFSKTGLNLGAEGWTYFVLGENQAYVGDANGLPVDSGGVLTEWYVDYDDIAVSTTGRVGPITSIPPPVIGEPVQNTITWSYNTADETLYAVTHFSLERKAESCAGTGAYAEIAQPAVGTRSYIDTAVSGGVTYCYRIAAVGSGGTSPYSNSAERTVPFDVPVAPTGLGVS